MENGSENYRPQQTRKKIEKAQARQRQEQRKKYTRRAILGGVGALGLGIAGFEIQKRLDKENNNELEKNKIIDLQKQAIRLYNLALGKNLDQDDILRRTLIAHTEQEFTQLEGERGKEVKGRKLAVTQKSDIDSASTIIINRQSLAKVALENGMNEAQRDEFMLSVLTHELVHQDVASYKSDAIEELLFKYIWSNYEGIKGINYSDTFVNGAKLQFKSDGKDKSFYKAVEEGEAYTISDYIMNSSGYRSFGEIFDVQDARIQTGMTKKLLESPNGHYSENIKRLSQFRSEERGREKYCEWLAEKYKKPKDESLLFGYSIFTSMELERNDLFEAYTNIKTSSLPQTSDVLVF